MVGGGRANGTNKVILNFVAAFAEYNGTSVAKHGRHGLKTMTDDEPSRSYTIIILTLSNNTSAASSNTP